MRKLLPLVFIFLLACGAPQKGDKKLITVSILPQKFFVEKIAGDFFDVQVLVPPGASPATYSLVPSQMKGLSRSLAWFRIGKIGFEEAWYQKIEDTNPNLKVFDTSKMADWIASNEEQHSDHEHDNGIDPHIWMAPDEVLKIAELTAQAFIKLVPEKQAYFESNLDTFKKEIHALDQELKHKFEGITNRKFLIFHPSLTYLAREYDLTQVAVEVEGKEPSPRYMSLLVEQARDEGIRVIFIQKEFDMENARQLADEIQGDVVQIDPLNENWEAQLREIADKIVEAAR
jgi:zinc transport system substrate-binding protein